MKKRYRHPKPKTGEIIVKRGKLDGEVDICIYYGDDVPICDRTLVANMLFSKVQRTDFKTMLPVFSPSFLEELELRGYDLDTLRFSVRLKATKGGDL